MTVTYEFVPACRKSVLQPERGVAALLPDGAQMAVVRTFDGEVRAIGNIDPFSGAAVLSRGIAGDRTGVPVVISPVYRHAFNLRTGTCLADPNVSATVFEVRCVKGTIRVVSSP